MKKSSLPVGVKTLLKYYKSGSLELQTPVQRATEQWNLLQQSLLIHSMLSDYIIPNLYFGKEQKNGESVLFVLDGLQRISTVFRFCQDEFCLHPKTPDAVIDDVNYSIALKKFSELDEEVKAAILGYRFTSYQLEDCTPEEIEETFTRLNSGTPLSKVQLARPKLGVSLAAFFQSLVSHDFFQKSLNLTLSQIRKEDDFLILLTAVMLLEDRYYHNFKIKTSVSAAECVRFAEEIRKKYSDEKRKTLELLVSYLDEAFGLEEYKFLRKNNAPIVMYVGFEAIQKGIPAEFYRTCVIDFFQKDCTKAYQEASGSGNVKLGNVDTRLRELSGYLFSKFCESSKEYEMSQGDAVKRIEDSSEEESDIPN